MFARGDGRLRVGVRGVAKPSPTSGDCPLPKCTRQQRSARENQRTARARAHAADGRCEVDGYGDCIWLRRCAEHYGHEASCSDVPVYPEPESQGLRTGQIEVHWIQGIGSAAAPAPQARLMATVINGILSRKLPWGLVLIGVSLVIAVELLGIRSLPFAVGAYLPIGTTLPIFVGGVVRWMVDQAAKRHGEGADAESEISPGSLFASGLIAAGGIVGLIGVALKAYEATVGKSDIFNIPHTFLDNNYVSVLAFTALAYSLYYFARKPLKK